MKKISLIASFLMGGLLVAFLMMPTFIEARHVTQSAQPTPGAQPTSGTSPSSDQTDAPVDNNARPAPGEPKEIPGGEPLKISILQMVSHPSLDVITDGVIDELAHRGYIDGVNIEIEFQNGNGDQNLLKTISDDFIADDKDILIGVATPAAQALMNAAGGDVPVVFAGVSDAIGAGLALDLKAPGINVTGASFTNVDPETLDLILELSPDIERLGIIYSSSSQNVVEQVDSMAGVARERGLEVQEGTITSTNDLAQVAEQLAGDVDAIFVPQDNTIASAMDTLIAATDAYGIPVYPVVDSMVAQGGVATVGINQYVWGRDSGTATADIIEGADPATYPVIMTATTDVYINTVKAAELGITIPDHVLEIAIDMAGTNVAGQE